MRNDWTTISFEEATINFDGKRKPLSKQKRESFKGKYPYYGACEIIDFVEDYIFEGEYLLIGEDGANLLSRAKPLSFIATGKFWVNNHAHIIRPKNGIDLKFINYQFNSLRIDEYVTGTAQPKLNQANLNKIKINICPLPEQRAIVAKIEQLFSDLDNGIANLKAAQAKLDIYRQAVLKQAFEGELTREWREKQPVIPVTALSKIANIGTGATPKKSEPSYWNNGDIAWVTSGALNDLFVNAPSDLITAKAVKETNCKVFPIGTLLVAMYGEGKTRGKCSELKIPASTNQAIAAINLKSDFLSSKSYVKWFLVKNYNDIRIISSGGVQPNLNLAKVKSIELPFPSIEEQTQIVQEIEARLSVCDKLAETIQTSLQQAEALHQSILKKAFEGRLLTETELQTCKAQADWMPAEQLLSGLFTK